MLLKESIGTHAWEKMFLIHPILQQATANSHSKRE